VSALFAARSNGYGRMVAGLALLLAPGAVARRWLGDAAAGSGAEAPLRALGARDVLLGFLTVHVADRPGVGRRTLAGVAAMDAVDCLATAAVRDRVPAAGAAGVMALAAGSALQLALAAASLGD
jgi:hypothetical protein